MDNIEKTGKEIWEQMIDERGLRFERDVMTKDRKLKKFLKYLMEGQTIAVDGSKYTMDDNYNLIMLAEKTSNGVISEIGIIVDVDLAGIAKMADSIPVSAYLWMGVNSSLMERDNGKLRK